MYGKADTHIHTNFSDGLLSPEETVEFVTTKTDLQVIAITDHNTAEGAFVARAYARQHTPHLEVIIGQEVSTGDGDVVGLFLTDTLPRFKTAAEAVAAIHAQGGLAIAVHPFSRWATFRHMKGIGTKIFALPLDGVEIRNGFPANFASNPMTTWLNRYWGQNLPELGGSDSHLPFTIGQPCTLFKGRTADDLRYAIESGATRVQGHFWGVSSMIRMLPSLFKRRGLPGYEQAFSD
jgi:predicted metal-dependent phosphoesterase TrpH